ncbi:hypothetical protein H4R18_000341 [Coemansia javaensis]|uniref:Ndc10 domain-containing protein n=1 Tax=Coemansia javaensis TaxID=2761396 RepID=A0A9W8HP03_9FUNG|nr:hypothetical protein H4R18_000341 [Coemansia javaensis]
MAWRSVVAIDHLRCQLQRAKDVLERCDTVSLSTKGCYSSRIALWIHFCNLRYGGNDIITEERLAEYVEWMVSSGAADRIRQGPTHIQQVLRNQLQGVMCFWRIQNPNYAEMTDPRMGKVFTEKWQQIALRYPRSRQPRRAEPIYGAHRASQPVEPDHRPSGTVTHVTPISNSSAMASRHIAAHPPQVASGAMPGRPTVPVAPGAPAARHPSHYDPARAGAAPHPRPHYVPSPQTHDRHSPSRAHFYPDSGARYPHDAQPSYRHHRHQQPQFPPRALPAYGAEPKYPTAPAPAPAPSAPHQLQPAPHVPRSTPQPGSYHLAPIGNVSPGTTNSSSDAQVSRASLEPVPRASVQSSNTTAPARQSSGSQAPADRAKTPHNASTGVSPQPGTAVASAPTTPKQPVAPVAGQRAEGRMPETMPAWTGEGEPEGHLLNTSETVALVLRQLGASAKLSVRLQAHAHFALGMATWLPVAARSELTLADVGIDESLGGQQDPALKAIAVAARADGSPAGSAVALRHANPLMCSWGALALCLFARWQVAGEATPDFSSTAWQEQRLFPAVADGEYSRLFGEVVAEVSNDRIDGSQAMGDCGFFYAAAMGLVRPTASGIKGLDAVGAVDPSVLQPAVLLALARANAGLGADATKPVRPPKRFGVMPSPSLVKEVFPWLKTVLIDAFLQNTDNEAVYAARRLLKVLRELRVVLLQDVAFLMGVPSVVAAAKSSPLFAHPLFCSPEFLAFRDEMQAAVGESEAKDFESLCTASLAWTVARRQAMPEGAASRMHPTAPRLPSPSCTVVPPSDEGADRKRRCESDSVLVAGGDRMRTMSAEPNGSDPAPKRVRLEHGAAGSPPSGRVFGGSTAGPTVDAGAPGLAPVVQDPSPRLLKMVSNLRTENEDLKAHLRKLEWALSQHKAEMRNWMQKVEGGLRGIAAASARQASSSQAQAPKPTSEASMRRPTTTHRQLLPGPPAPSSTPSSSSSSKYPGQPQQHPTYPSSSYREMGHMPPPSAREDVAVYERQMAMHNSPSLPQRMHHSQLPPEYRNMGPALQSPRTQSYASRMTPGSEHPDHRYYGHYGGHMSRPATNSGYPEHHVYAKHHEPQYPAQPQPSPVRNVYSRPKY